MQNAGHTYKKTADAELTMTDQPPLASAPTISSGSPAQHFEFTGSGSEYFRIWIVNVLLTIVTIGIYSAWAKVRRLRYFYNNTRFAGSSFDFHGSPIAILKGRLIAVVLIALINVPFVGLAFLLLYLCGLPWLLYRSMRFHLANTSYRNVRFAFLGDAKGAYRALLLPLGAVIATGVAGGLLMLVSKALGLAVLVIAVLAMYGVGPYLQFRLRRYYTEGARAGASEFGFHLTVGQYYVVYLVALGFMIAVGAIASVVIGLTLGMDVASIVTGGGGLPVAKMVAIFVLIGGFYLALLAIGPLLIAMLQNTVWRGTSLAGARFNSNIAVPSFMITWLGVTLLTVVTLGLYRPFAAVTLARIRIEAMSWQGSADDMIAVLREGNQRAMGSEVADLMDVDIGL
jgi:uncharacterized membrane protein YjgN (DUF898 family)